MVLFNFNVFIKTYKKSSSRAEINPDSEQIIPTFNSAENPMSQLQRIAIAPSQFQQEQILLTPQQQHYLGRVLRLCDGDHFIAMDGKGKWWLAQLEGEKAQILELLTVQTELPVSITLIIALPKGNGFDDVVRCSTELGVAVIAPVVSDC